MSRKHNAPHPERGRSRYKLRLSNRGLSKTPAMRTLEYLRGKQKREAEQVAEGRD